MRKWRVAIAIDRHTTLQWVRTFNGNSLWAFASARRTTAFFCVWHFLHEYCVVEWKKTMLKVSRTWCTQNSRGIFVFFGDEIFFNRWNKKTTQYTEHHEQHEKKKFVGNSSCSAISIYAFTYVSGRRRSLWHIQIRLFCDLENNLKLSLKEIAFTCRWRDARDEELKVFFFMHRELKITLSKSIALLHWLRVFVGKVCEFWKVEAYQILDQVSSQEVNSQDHLSSSYIHN